MFLSALSISMTAFYAPSISSTTFLSSSSDSAISSRAAYALAGSDRISAIEDPLPSLPSS